jgi:hypothetical protein
LRIDHVALKVLLESATVKAEAVSKVCRPMLEAKSSGNENLDFRKIYSQLAKTKCSKNDFWGSLFWCKDNLFPTDLNHNHRTILLQVWPVFE